MLQANKSNTFPTTSMIAVLRHISHSITTYTHLYIIFYTPNKNIIKWKLYFQCKTDLSRFSTTSICLHFLSKRRKPDDKNSWRLWPARLWPGSLHRTSSQRQESLGNKAGSRRRAHVLPLLHRQLSEKVWINFTVNGSSERWNTSYSF